MMPALWAAVRRMAPKMFLPIGFAAYQMGFSALLWRFTFRKNGLSAWPMRASLLLMNCSNIKTGHQGVPFDQALGAKARRLPSPLLVLVTRSFSSRYRWPLKCSLAVRSPTVSWQHLWDPLRDKIYGQKEPEYKQMIIETIVGLKDFNLLFSTGLCLVGAVALTNTLQERSLAFTMSLAHLKRAECWTFSW